MGRVGNVLQAANDQHMIEGLPLVVGFGGVNERLAREQFAEFRRWQRLRSYEDRRLMERAAVS